MLELHYPIVTKTILERQYPGKPTLKVAFGNSNGAIFKNSSKLRAYLFVTSRWPRSSGQTNYQVHHPPPPIDVQSASSWAPKVAGKCESKHWHACGADGRSVGHVITKFSGMGRLPYLWGSAHAREARVELRYNKRRSYQSFP